MAFLISSKLSTFLLNFLSLLYVIKLLSITEFGLYTTILLVMPFISQLISLSNYEYLLRELIDGSGDDAKLFSSVLIMPIFLSILIALILSFTFSSISIYVFIYFVFLCCFEYIQRYYISKSLSKYIALNDFLLNAGWVIVFYLLHNSSIGGDAFNDIFLSRVISVGFSLLFFTVIKIELIKNAQLSLEILLSSYKYGMPIVIGALSYALLRGIERILLSTYSSVEDAGIYSFIQVPLNVIFSFFTGTIFVTSIRHIRQSHVNGSENNVLGFVCNVVSLIFIPMLLVLGLNFDVFVKYFGDNKYHVSFIYPVLSCVSVFLFMLVTILKQDINLSNKGISNTKNFFFVLCLNVIISVFTYSNFGYKAAVLVNLLSNVMLYFLSVRVSKLKIVFTFKIFLLFALLVLTHTLIVPLIPTTSNIFYSFTYLSIETCLFFVISCVFFDFKSLVKLKKGSSYD